VQGHGEAESTLDGNRVRVRLMMLQADGAMMHSIRIWQYGVHVGYVSVNET